MLMLAFGVGATALLVSVQLGSPVLQIMIAAPAYFGALALALLFPHLFDLRDSRLIWSWALMWLAALIQTSAYVADISGRATIFDLLAPGLWAATWLVHLATLRQIAPDEIDWPDAPSMSEEQRLTRAFQFCYAGCYRLLRAVYGARRTTALDDRMDVLAATANWDVTLDRDRARIAPAVLALPLDMQGARYAEVLRYTVATIEQIAGATFARRAIQAAYDALPWPERETASRYCFPDTPWARELSSAFGDVRDGRLRLLRQVEHLVVGQFLLAVVGEQRAIAKQRGGVVNAAIRIFGVTDHDGDAANFGAHAIECRIHLLAQSVVEQQVFGGIARQAQLGHQHQVGLEPAARLVRRVDDALHVARDVAHEQVDLGKADTERGGRHGMSGLITQLRQ
jgi:hypothetical protein